MSNIAFKPCSHYYTLTEKVKKRLTANSFSPAWLPPIDPSVYREQKAHPREGRLLEVRRCGKCRDFHKDHSDLRLHHAFIKQQRLQSLVVKKAGFAGVEAWTSTAHLKAAPDMVSGRGLKRVQRGEKKEAGEGELDCSGTDPFFFFFF